MPSRPFTMYNLCHHESPAHYFYEFQIVSAPDARMARLVYILVHLHLCKVFFLSKAASISIKQLTSDAL
jgi:hypothetical protein